MSAGRFDAMAETAVDVLFGELLGDDDYESLPSSSPAVHMLAGAAAGMFEHTLMFPLDVVKVTLVTAARHASSLPPSPTVDVDADDATEPQPTSHLLESFPGVIQDLQV